jgi:hypothetical protein
MIHRVRAIRADLHFEDGILPAAANTFDSHTNRCQVFGEFAIVDRYVDEVANPMGRKFHKKAASYQPSAFSYIGNADG